MLGLWICLIILLVRQAFEDALGSKYPSVLNMALLYMQGLLRVLNISKYSWIMPEWYAWIMPEYAWICLMSLNMPENACINCSDYARIPNIPQYSYNNIIVVTYVTILEFLPAQFMHSGALQLTILSILSFFNTI